MNRVKGILVALFSLVGVAHAQTVEYIHTDALGSIVAVTDENGNVIERREYEPFGAQLAPSVSNGPGYTGHVQDAATGLVYMQQRYYDAQIGRFLSVDPVTAHANPGQNFNRYWYGNNNPYKFTDPDGRIAVLIPLIEACAASVACGTAVAAAGVYVAHQASEALEAIYNEVVSDAGETPQPSASGDSPSNDDKLDGLINSGKKEGESSTTKISRPGGEEARDREYGDLGLKNVEGKGNGVKVGETDSGRRVVSRPSTEDGRPTIEVQRPDGKPSVKIRYDDK